MKLYRKDPLYECWRVAAIYRCVLHYGQSREWALEKLRAIRDDGRFEAVVDNWFTDIDSLRASRELSDPQEAEYRMAA